MSVLSKLSSNDKKMIETYINYFGETTELEEGNFTMNKSYDDIADIEYRLREWDNAKSEYLEKMFGNDLIKKIPITYAKPIEEVNFEKLYETKLHKAMIHIACQKQFSFGTYAPEDIDENYVYEYLLNGVWCNELGNDFWNRNFHCYHLMDTMRQVNNLFDNIYHGETYILKWHDKEIKVPNGMKLSRIVSKLSKFFELPEEDYEEWRILHSQLTNTKFIKGNLCLSIHPLDYITMSDATYSSCMNWMRGGCYRRGTVEMMNSPSVVVVYLESEHDTLEFSPYEWNLKKWRTLIIVAPQAVCSIKAYPYPNDELTIKAIDILTDMARPYLGDYYEQCVPFDASYFTTYLPTPEEEMQGVDEGYIVFTSNRAMYCDFGAATHFIRLNSDFDTHTQIIIDYTGKDICMFCGRETYGEDYHDEGCVFCNDCREYYDESEITYCSCCGTTIYDEDSIYWSEDEPYCESCASRYLRTCAVCGQLYHEDNVYPLLLSYKGINTRIKHNVNSIRVAHHNDRYESDCSWVCSHCFNDVYYYQELQNHKLDNDSLLQTFYVNRSARTERRVKDALHISVDALVCRNYEDDSDDETPYMIIDMDKGGDDIYHPYFFEHFTQITDLKDFARWLYDYQCCALPSSLKDTLLYSENEIYEMIKPTGKENRNIIDRGFSYYENPLVEYYINTFCAREKQIC